VSAARDALHQACYVGMATEAEADARIDAFRAEVLLEAAALLDSLMGDGEHLTRDWNWWDAATIPASCAALLRRTASPKEDTR
jgi:hypothetical protein